jgi:hypothetical protein
MKYTEFVKKYFLLTKLMHGAKWVTMTTYSIKLVDLVNNTPELYRMFSDERQKFGVLCHIPMSMKN